MVTLSLWATPPEPQAWHTPGTGHVPAVPSAGLAGGFQPCQAQLLIGQGGRGDPGPPDPRPALARALTPSITCEGDQACPGRVLAGVPKFCLFARQRGWPLPGPSPAEGGGEPGALEQLPIPALKRSPCVPTCRHLWPQPPQLPHQVSHPRSLTFTVLTGQALRSLDLLRRCAAGRYLPSDGTCLARRPRGPAWDRLCPIAAQLCSLGPASPPSPLWVKQISHLRAHTPP